MTIQERHTQETAELENLYAERAMIDTKIRYAEKRLKITKSELAELTEKPASEELKEISQNLVN